jgi:hypothetical protein
MLNHFTFQATPFFAGLLLSLALLRALFARLANLRVRAD